MTPAHTGLLHPVAPYFHRNFLPPSQAPQHTHSGCKLGVQEKQEPQANLKHLHGGPCLAHSRGRGPRPSHRSFRHAGRRGWPGAAEALTPKEALSSAEPQTGPGQEVGRNVMPDRVRVGLPRAPAPPDKRAASTWHQLPDPAPQLPGLGPLPSASTQFALTT